ncbi:hypothetical protein YPPY66_4661, partial [Yersinia pestis PY-66]
MVVQEQ